jgi:peptidyl-prolyl cis-trans isomerase D
VRSGQSLEDAARAANLRSNRFGPFGRRPEPGAPGLTIPPELLPPLFGARRGEATMVPTRAGFAVGQLLEIVPADVGADADALENARRTAQAQSAEDLEAQFAAALRARAAPQISPTLMQQIIP